MSPFLLKAIENISVAADIMRMHPGIPYRGCRRRRYILEDKPSWWTDSFVFLLPQEECAPLLSYLRECWKRKTEFVCQFHLF